MESKRANEISIPEVIEIRDLISDLPEKIGLSKEKNVVFVIGNTGAGKSTTINYLLGCEMTACILHLMSELPQNLMAYRRSYILVNEQLRYVKSNKRIEVVNIDDISKFLSMVKGMSKHDAKEILLSERQAHQLITSNGGHVFEKQSGLSEYNARPIPLEGKKFAPVGHGTNSETLYPEAYISEDNSFLAYYDFPGFAHNKERTEKICAAIATEFTIKKLANQADKILIMVVIDVPSLTATRGDGFKNLICTLSKLLKAPNKLNGSILFVFTKYPPGTTSDDIIEKIEDFIDPEALRIHTPVVNFHLSLPGKKLSEDKEAALEMLALIKKNHANMVLIDVFDQGESRAYIIEKLQKLQPTSQAEFKFDSYDADRDAFNKTILNIAETGQLMIDSMSGLAKKLYHDRQILSECEEKSLFYKAQILKCSSSLEPDSCEQTKKIAEQMEIFEQKLHLVLDPLNRSKQNITELDETIAKDTVTLKSINVDTPYMYWEDSIHDERWRWLGMSDAPMPTRTNKVFEYPYKGVPIAHIETEKTNGIFSSFQTEKDWAQGVYKVQYDSERGQDGDASVKAYIQMRLRPDNAQYIPLLNERLRQNEIDKKSAEQEHERLEGEKSAFERAIASFRRETRLTEQQISSLRTAERISLEKVKDLKASIPKTASELQKLQLDFYGYEIHLMSSHKVPNKIDLDEKYKDKIPMLIHHEQAVWLYGPNNDQTETKLTQSSKPELYKMLAFTAVPHFDLIEISDEMFQDFGAKKPCMRFASRRAVFNAVKAINDVVKYDSALVKDFLKSLAWLEAGNLIKENDKSHTKIELDYKESADYKNDSRRKNFECSIDWEIMQNPVMTSCGHSFDLSNITKCCDDSHMTCPVCQQEISNNEFFPNINLKSSIDEWEKRKEEKFNLYEAPLDKFGLFFHGSIEERDQKTIALKTLRGNLNNKLVKIEAKVEQLTARKNTVDEMLAGVEYQQSVFLTKSTNIDRTSKNLPNFLGNKNQTKIHLLLDSIGKIDSDSYALSDEIDITRGEVAHSISDMDNSYTADFVNMLLYPFNSKELSIKTYPAIPFESLGGFYKIISTQNEDYAFIPLNVAYDEKAPKHKNHWAALMVDKKYGLMLYFDPAQKKMPRQIENLKENLGYKESIILNPINFQMIEQAEGWVRHCGVYVIEIFKRVSHCINNRNYISGSELANPKFASSISAKTVLSDIPCGAAENISKIREAHIEAAYYTITIHSKESPAQISNTISATR